jgi:hypothetical protein
LSDLSHAKKRKNQQFFIFPPIPWKALLSALESAHGLER